MQLSITALWIAVAFAALGGCGQTGPLYMPAPEETAPQAEPAASGEHVDHSATGT